MSESLEDRIGAIVRNSLAEGLRSTSKSLPAFGATVEADEEERRRVDEQTRALEERLAREEEESRLQEERERQKHKRLSNLLGI